MMQPFPKEFLEQVATDKYLTEEQREVFVALYLEANRAPESIANDLHISPNAFRTRLTGVYKAFGIDGKGSNKKRRLHGELLEMYRQRQGRDSDDPILDRGIDDFVERVRRQVEPDIRQRCGTMRVLDMAQPVGLGEIYTDVNILAKVSRTSRKGLAQIQEMVGLDLENFERFSFGEISKERVAGLEVVKEYHKLMIWGKPGAGKTTFLKHLAMSCIRGELFPKLVPFFVTLKSFAEEDGQPNLFTYLQSQAEMHGVEPERMKEIINAGRAMILLDGLDEVNQEDSRRVIKGIQEFADLWRDNFFAITCRIAAKEYTFQGGFTEVEVADFDKEQIACFVNNWFRCKGQDTKANEFIHAIKKQKPIQDLASSPLLLTLLCLVFEENFQFPQNRAELYKDGLDILLKKWDGKRAIQRDEIYKNLTVKRREQMLSEIAFKTFEKGEYFFKQSRAEDLILGFIQNLPDAKNDPEALRLDSEIVLKAIEAQHGILVERVKGIYSFSHLTFQEYLTAQYLACRKNIDSIIARNFGENQWTEVICLFFQLVEDSKTLSRLSITIKKMIDKSVDHDGEIFLKWLEEKSNSNPFLEMKEHSEIAIFHGIKINEAKLFARVLYFYFELRKYIFDWLQIDTSSKGNKEKYLQLAANDILLQTSLNESGNLTLDFYLYNSLRMNLELRYAICEHILNSLEYKTQANKKNKVEISDLLFEFMDGIPASEKSEIFIDLWNDFLQNKDSDIKTWVHQESSNWQSLLNENMIFYCDIGHNWRWTKIQKKTLENYWNNNRFLLECLQFAYVNRDVREWIENTMFLPMSELEKMPPPEL